LDFFAGILESAARGVWARFHVQGMAPGSSKFFVGCLPCGSRVIASLVHGLQSPLHVLALSIAWFLLATSLGALMTSTVRYYSFKDIPGRRAAFRCFIILLILMCAVVWKFRKSRWCSSA